MMMTMVMLVMVPVMMYMSIIIMMVVVVMGCGFSTVFAGIAVGKSPAAQRLFDPLLQHLCQQRVAADTAA
ncbi:hypothetical protein D3C86_2246720 [compost metagenome]